jgi:hypothetical protein
VKPAKQARFLRFAQQRNYEVIVETVYESETSGTVGSIGTKGFVLRRGPRKIPLWFEDVHWLGLNLE